MPSKYAIGVDFGSESGRAVLIDVSNGKEIASSVYPYSNSVIDEKLPGTDIRLDLDWALQDPDDYIRTFQNTIPAVLRESGVKPEDVIGLGIDFTACTMLPVKADGTPLCTLPEYRKNPHSWVKLWKHHAAQPEADKINETARAMNENWLDRYGGKISSEWFFSKVLQIANEDPSIYKAADRMIEAADWVVWRLTGIETRNSCTAGYKAIWSKRDGFPSKAFFKALNPLIENVVEEKMTKDIVPIGQKAGGLSDEAAKWTGLLAGTAVAVANVDAHVAVPAATVTKPGTMVMIMGTSTCDMVLGTEEHIVPGMCGYVEDGIIPGYFGYEAGQSCVGDHFAWFVDNCVPASYKQEAADRNLNIHKLLEEKASKLKPGESGLLALDWWNGNRSVLVDVNLTGMMLGMTLATKPEEIYRALIEATAYGKRIIIETFQKNGVPINELVTCGGLPEKNPMLMQIYADVIGVPLKLSASKQTPALGSAMFGAVAAGKAAGGYDSIVDAAKAMAAIKDIVYKPNPENQKIYEKLYQEYVLLHDYFGRGANDVMKRLKAIKVSTR
ncbi:MAG: ribulokinase [Leptolinea sp.]|nr:ribulokinase [Leptolinea sp.]